MSSSRRVAERNLPGGPSARVPQGYGLLPLAELRCDDEVPLHPADREPFDSYNIAFPQQEPACLEESRWRQADESVLRR